MADARYPTCTPAQPRRCGRGVGPRNPDGTRGAKPGPSQPRYIKACHQCSNTLVTWDRREPEKRSYGPMYCDSWRHPGPCQSRRFHEDRRRIEAAIADVHVDDLAFAVLSFDPKRWDAHGYRPAKAMGKKYASKVFLSAIDRIALDLGPAVWRLPHDELAARMLPLLRANEERLRKCMGIPPDWRAKSYKVQIDAMFEGLVQCWRRLYLGSGKRDGTGKRNGIRDQLGIRDYVCTIEVMRRGWPHLNVILVGPKLGESVRARTEAVGERMKSWRHYEQWTQQRRRDRLLHCVAQDFFPRLEQAGFGLKSSLEAVRHKTEIANYVAKLAMNDAHDPHNRRDFFEGEHDPKLQKIAGEWAKMSQVPYQAKKNFRRLRASKGFLPPARPERDPHRTGCIVDRFGNHIAGTDYPERKQQSDRVCGTLVAQGSYESSSDVFREHAQHFDAQQTGIARPMTNDEDRSDRRCGVSSADTSCKPSWPGSVLLNADAFARFDAVHQRLERAPRYLPNFWDHEARCVA